MLEISVSSILDGVPGTLCPMLGDRIKRARERKELTQAALGEMVGVSGSAVSQWEDGQTKNLKIQTFFKVADALGIHPRELATGRPSVEEPMAPDVRQLVDAYLSSDDEYKVIVYSVANATPIQRRELAKAVLEALIRANQKRPPEPDRPSFQ